MPKFRFEPEEHAYYLDGEHIPSVTQILDAGFPKPALTYWAANSVAAYAVDHWEELDAAPMSERQRTLSRSPWSQRDKAAFRGTELHDIGHRLASGEDVAVPAHYEHIAQLYADWLDEWDAEIYASERPVLYLPDGVGGSSLSYAGTFDLIADLNDGGRWLLDIKTGSGVYDSHVLQLAGYRYATHLLHASGDLIDMPQIDMCGVVFVQPDHVSLIPVAADNRAFRVFNAIRYVAAYAEDIKRAKARRRAWPVGRPIEPEVKAI